MGLILCVSNNINDYKCCSNNSQIGVAPRAKMNQQRPRRFRSAKDARERKESALARGERLPDEVPFDSNCITPGMFTPLSNHIQILCLT